MIKEFVIVEKEDGTLKLKTVKKINAKSHFDAIDDIVSILNKTYYLNVADSEYAFLVVSDIANNIIGFYQVSIGDYWKCDMYKRTIGAFLLLSGAKRFFLFHNHPNNNIGISAADIANDASMSVFETLFQIDYAGGFVITRDSFLRINN